MEEIEKHCNTCGYSYYASDTHAPLSGRKVQCCRNPIYNSSEYTHEMLMEDWDNGCCRFWTAKN